MYFLMKIYILKEVQKTPLYSYGKLNNYYNYIFNIVLSERENFIRFY